MSTLAPAAMRIAFLFPSRRPFAIAMKPQVVMTTTLPRGTGCRFVLSPNILHAARCDVQHVYGRLTHIRFYTKRHWTQHRNPSDHQCSLASDGAVIASVLSDITSNNTSCLPSLNKFFDNGARMTSAAAHVMESFVAAGDTVVDATCGKLCSFQQRKAITAR